MNVERLYSGLLRGFRRRRMAFVAANFDLGPGRRILDVGGTTYNWGLIEQQADITLLNLAPPDPVPADIDEFELVLGDAREMSFADDSFDFVFSNSVLEHMESLQGQIDYAHHVRRVAPEVFVQAPAWEFPVEPHYLTPFVHWLPKRVQKAILRRFSVWGLLTKPSQRYVDRMVDEIRLPTRKEFERLFPDCEITVERVLGIPKAYYAVRARR